MTLKEYVRTYMKRKALTVATFSEKSGISQTVLSRLDKKEPSARTYQKLALAMNVDVEELTGLEVK